MERKIKQYKAISIYLTAEMGSVIETEWQLFHMKQLKLPKEQRITRNKWIVSVIKKGLS